MSIKIRLALIAIIALSIATFFIWIQPCKKEQALVPIPMLKTAESNKLTTFNVSRIPKATRIIDVGNNDSSIIQNTISSQELELIAMRHEQILRYPPYSQPILDENSPFLDWNHFEEVSVPVLDGKDSARLSVKSYRHFFPDAIEVKLKSSTEVLSAVLDIEDVENQKILATIPMEGMGWTITPYNDWPEELRLIARINFEQGEDIISADLRLYHSVASIVNVGETTAKNTDMLIPITLQIDKAGIYRIRSNLYQSNGTAVASLMLKQHLSQGEQSVRLRAFHNVLPKGDVEYELRDIMVERMSGLPGEKAQYGQSEDDVYPIGSFDSTLLSNEPYEMSDKEKQQLHFLHQASN